MKSIFNWKILFIIIIVIAASIRLWQLDKVPTGISDDEMNFLVNAKAIFYTGHNLVGNWSPYSLTPITGEFAQAELPYLLMAPFVGPPAFSLFMSKLPYAVISILQVVILFLIVKKLVGRNEALVVALVAALNPWSIFFGRTAYEAPLALFFYLAAFSILVIAKKWKILFAFIPLFLGFYSYMGTKLIFIPFVSIVMLYSWYILNKKEYLKQYLVLFSLCLLLFASFIFSVQTQSASMRLSELSTPNSPAISKTVDTERRLSINTPLTKIESNKLAVWVRDSVGKYLKVFSSDLLFATGEGRATFSLWYHGYFYYIDIIFLFLGLYMLFRKNKPLWTFLVALIAIAPIPTVASNSVTGFVALRSVLLYPLFIMFIGLGIWYFFDLCKKSQYRTVIYSLVFILYAFHILNFINIYFFRNPIYNSEAYNLSSRIVSKYISLAGQHGKRVFVVSTSPNTYFRHFLFETNAYNKDNAMHIQSLFQEKKFELNNMRSVMCAGNLEIGDGDIIITDASQKCESINFAEKKDFLRIPLLADGGTILEIYNDSICAKYSLESYPHDFHITDFAIEKLDEKRFCEKFITDLTDEEKLNRHNSL